ncbi:hypothetical protein TGCAST_254310 [Toxoplasma gondii CAST]|uniref:Uncharacterized protein n=1 Tax=Toxoplasma gondii CAST TaxID=943122 RepID=A0A425HRE5_TOXGO|nr:hypothetical protein TGCAST_254310 [Toxoplasma gondii CAST]
MAMRFNMRKWCVANSPSGRVPGKNPNTRCCRNSVFLCTFVGSLLPLFSLRRLSLGWTCTAELLLLYSLLLQGHLPQLRKLQFSGPSGGSGLSMMHLQLYALLNSPPPVCPHHPPLPRPRSGAFRTSESWRNFSRDASNGLAAPENCTRSTEGDVCFGRHIGNATEDQLSEVGSTGNGLSEPNEVCHTENGLCMEARQQGESEGRGESHELEMEVSSSRSREPSDYRSTGNGGRDYLLPVRRSEQESEDVCVRCARMRDGTAHGVYFKYAALDIDFDALLKFRLALKLHGLFAFYRDERNKLNLLHVEG